MSDRHLLAALALFLALAPFGAAAQTAKPLGPEDAVRAYQAAQTSRAAVRDQLDLCAEDADKLEQVFAKLRPTGSNRTEWTDWGTLSKGIGGELLACLRAYAKQIALHNRDVAVLRDRLPLLKEPKRLTISPKQVAEINAYVGALDKELAGYATRARGMASAAQASTDQIAALLRDAGVTKIDMPRGFSDGL